MKFTSILLLALLLFGNVVSASLSVCEVFDYQHGTEQSISDEETQSNDADCCDHYCNCVKQMNSSTINTRVIHESASINPIIANTFHSQSSPPLLRPPIS